MQIEFFPDEYSIYRLPAASPTTGKPISLHQAALSAHPEANNRNEFFTISQTPFETSIVSTSDRQAAISSCLIETNGLSPTDLKIEPEFCCFRVAGELDFDLIGIIAKISKIFADQKIPILSISTFNTDYFLVANDKRNLATELLSEAGYILGDQ